MYHRTVAGKVRQAFADMNAGRPDSLADVMASRFTYRFYGGHSLSGERHTLQALRLWSERAARLLPNTRLNVDEVIVSGWPWSTRIATRISVTAPLPDGAHYENVFMQFMRMRWARITEVQTLEDTVVPQRALDTIAACGILEAHAAPITDHIDTGQTD
jgi:ketosteroid isomerase-like protein